jgi:curved DNA-binding protein
MKDYYKILGVTKTTGEEELRKKYRKLAMQYHPDRNPDDPAAEEKFKEIAEAYGVLTDPVKKREYEACRASGRVFTDSQPGGGDGFTYSQEDILRDLFKDPRFQQMFNGVLREFQRSGFRHSSQFIRKSFFGGKGGIFVGGIFLIGSLAKPLLTGVAKKGLSGKSSVLKSVGSAVGSMLGMGKGKSVHNSSKKGPVQAHLSANDTTYHTPLTERELRHGKTIQVLVYGEEGEQTLKVSIPPGSRDGQKLRIRGKGRPGPLGRGDLYLHLVKKKP